MRTEVVELALLLREISRLTDFVYERDMMPEVGINRAQFFVLLNLMENKGEGMTQIELANHIGTNAIALGRMIDRLERDKLVLRKVDDSDRRAKRILLTREGKHMVRRIFDLEAVQKGPSLQGMPRPKILTLNQLLRMLKKNLDVAEATSLSSADKKALQKSR